MLRPILAALLSGAALFGATAAQAGTHWSIGISLPPVGVVVADTPRYYAPPPVPVYYEPAPVVRYAPAPRYIEREVYYAPPPPPRVVYEHRWDRRDDGWDRRDWHHGRGDHRDDHGPRRGR